MLWNEVESIDSARIFCLDVDSSYPEVDFSDLGNGCHGIDGIIDEAWEDEGRFPFDQKFRFEMTGIPCGKWNRIFREVAPTGHLPSFARKYKINQSKQMADSLPLLLASTTLKLKRTIF